jgi:DMSO/TMAO reductase YedYZ molybdopterin-dependent catalytic subunit
MAANLPKETDRITAVTLAGAVVILWASGIVMLYGSWLPWLFDLHRLTGFVLILLLPFKAATIFHPGQGIDIKTGGRTVEILLPAVLTGWTLLIIALGLAWMWRMGPYSGLSQTLITWHWILGVLVLPVFLLQAWRSWPRLPGADVLGRRSFLKLLGLAGVSLLFARLGVHLAEARATPDSPRRYTGSRGFGSFSGNDFPTTGESAPVIDAAGWRLAVDGAVRSPLRLAYPEILAQQSLVLAEAIDCHNGWFSLQNWQGISLANLLEQAGLPVNASGVRLVSATGLSNTYPLGEARRILLATHVSGQVLAAEHGFPLRAVVPGRRGWFWLKWLTRIEVLDEPLEVASGILCTPLQVLRDVEHPRASSDIP